MDPIHKAVPVVLRQRGGRVEILLFEHPVAGWQLVKGTIEQGESAADAALRELAEESGLNDGVVARLLGRQRYGDVGQEWHFVECTFARPLPERWSFFTEDGGGHLFRFSWHPLSAPIDNPFAPIFEQARGYIEGRLMAP